MYCMANKIMRVHDKKAECIYRILLLLSEVPLNQVPFRSNVNNELGLESLKFRRWFRKLFLFFTMTKPVYQSMFHYHNNHRYNSRSTKDVNNTLLHNKQF